MAICRRQRQVLEALQDDRPTWEPRLARAAKAEAEEFFRLMRTASEQQASCASLMARKPRPTEPCEEPQEELPVVPRSWAEQQARACALAEPRRRASAPADTGRSTPPRNSSQRRMLAAEQQRRVAALAQPRMPKSDWMEDLWPRGLSFLQTKCQRRTLLIRRAEEDEKAVFPELLSLLEKAGLSSYSSEVLQWCEDQGASSSEEVLENLEDLALDLEISDEKLEKLKLTHTMQQQLHEVCAAGDHLRLAQILPSCDLASKDPQNRSALHLAAAGGHVEVCRLLLESRPEMVTARDPEGRMPLHLAAFNGFTELVETWWKP
ncbi:unnamed protein product [Durusdinium trenchii]|uniref:Uncharacterized protein n=1 Tax=Durusdinium trenchii TaxID=1381693 RepID=A0ABP0KKS4_9DINO